MGQAGKVGGFRAAGAGSLLLPRVFMRQASQQVLGAGVGPWAVGQGCGEEAASLAEALRVALIAAQS